MKILVTGGAGFIGSNFIRYLLAARPEVEVVNLDKLTYAGNLENLAEVAHSSRYRFVRGDLADEATVNALLAEGFDAVVNCAAETHVDRSLEDASPFLRANVLGTHVLLEGLRRAERQTRLVHISTDEVYGSARAGESFREDSPLRPANPYAVSKAAADHLVRAYASTYGVAATIVRPTNNYGPYQFPEKFIPLAIAQALEDKPIPVYGDGQHERDWLYVEDCCRAAALALQHGQASEIYNVAVGAPRANVEVAEAILALLGKPRSLLQFVEDRPGHDRRYALDSSKFQHALGWKPEVSFEEGLRRTVEWYRSHRAWLERVRSGEYRNYFERHYTRRAETLNRLRT